MKRHQQFTIIMALMVLGSLQTQSLGHAAPTTANPPASAAPVKISPKPEDVFMGQALLDQAKQAVRTGRFNEAISKLEALRQSQPDNLLVLVSLADAYRQAGQWQEAVKRYQEATRRTSQDPMLYLSLGNIFESTQQWSQAKEAYLTVLHQAPEYTYAHWNLARTLVELRELPQAEQAYQRFLQAYPTHYDARRQLANVYRAMGQQPQAVAQFEQLKSQYPQKFSDFLPLAKALNQVNEPDKALRELSSAVRKYGQKLDLLEEMGNAHQALGETPYAIDAYEQALRLTLKPENGAKPNDAALQGLRLKLGQLYLNEKQPLQAAPHLEAALKTDPKNTQVREALAYAWQNAKQPEKAIPLYEALLNANGQPTEGLPDDKRYQWEKQLALAYQHVGKFDAAIPLYERLAQSDLGQDDADVARNLALAYGGQGNYAKAIPLLQRQLPLQPSSITPGETPDVAALPVGTPETQALSQDLSRMLMQYAEQLWQQRAYDSAITQLRLASQYASPADPEPNRVLAQRLKTFFERDPETYRGQGEEALRLFQAHLKTLSSAPENAETDHVQTRLDIASLSLGLGQPNLAVDTLAPVTLPGLLPYTRWEPSAVLRAPKRAAALYPMLTQALARQGQSDKALMVAQKGTNTYPTDAAQWVALGQQQLLSNKGAEAQSSFDRALQADAKNADAALGKARSLEQQQQWAEALAQWQWIERNPYQTYPVGIQQHATQAAQALQQRMAASSSTPPGPNKLPALRQPIAVPQAVPMTPPASTWDMPTLRLPAQSSAPNAPSKPSTPPAAISTAPTTPTIPSGVLTDLPKTAVPFSPQALSPQALPPSLQPLRPLATTTTPAPLKTAATQPAPATAKPTALSTRIMPDNDSSAALRRQQLLRQASQTSPSSKPQTLPVQVNKPAQPTVTTTTPTLRPLAPNASPSKPLAALRKPTDLAPALRPAATTSTTASAKTVLPSGVPSGLRQPIPMNDTSQAPVGEPQSTARSGKSSPTVMFYQAEHNAG